MGELYAYFKKKFTCVSIALLSNTAQINKTYMHYWTPKLIRSWKIYVCCV